jgi:hypothetical protein
MDVSNRVNKQRNDYKWQFVYLGANQDAFAEAGSIGISAKCTMNYDARRTPEAFTRLSAAMSQQASGGTQTIELAD